jgi:hypothetical protein
MIKSAICNILLALLNSRWLNSTPCRYEFCGNLDAFSRESLESEDRQQPNITVREVLAAADAFKSCPLNTESGLSVYEDGRWREGNLWDMHALRQDLLPEKEEEGNTDEQEFR